MAFEFAVPDKIFMGEGALALAKDTLANLGTHAFIVSGKVVTKTGLVDKLTDVLDEVGIKWTIFNDITNEPTDKMIEAGVKAYKDAGCDFGIGIGGGSPLDSVKAILAMTVEEGKISDYKYFSYFLSCLLFFPDVLPYLPLREQDNREEFPLPCFRSPHNKSARLYHP